MAMRLLPRPDARSLLLLGLLAGCDRPDAPLTAPGVSHELAALRARQISELRYELSVTVPAERERALTGTTRIRFRYQAVAEPLIVDFVDPLDRVTEVRVAGRSIEYGTTAEHIVIPPSDLEEGENEVTIRFIAGDASLNRNPDFLYTLLVPDRARYAFPVFDQPDLKARVTLELTVPKGWVAVGNGAEATEAAEVAAEAEAGAREGGRAGGPSAAPPNRSTAESVTLRFAQTQPIPTYLIAFAAGRFQIEEAVRDGRRLRMFHRETDAARVARNREAIVDLHAAALAWMEAYTGIPYPFDKFDFVAVPAFQYGGMEHPGAVYYRASSLFLEPSATQNEELGRASVIAHETAHMWFGDLVTMRWFDDVWMKEVFANFMAAKIVNPSFPEINHELRFLLAHHPPAYGVDRTAGANPIRQPLENLREAGTLYGAIIYQKAPILMRHLEQRVGADVFRDGLREYLQRFRFGNATWPDLIGILDSLVPEDLAEWSDVWMESAGRPAIATDLEIGPDGSIRRLAWRQADPEGLGRLWAQRLSPVLVYPDTVRAFGVDLREIGTALESALGLPAPLLVLANGDGLPYGEFVTDSLSLAGLVGHLPAVTDDLIRAAGWLTLWDAMLAGRVAPGTVLAVGQGMLETEHSELTAQRVLNDIEALFWRFLSTAPRDSAASALETFLWRQLERASSRSLKAAYFATYRTVALTPAAVARLARLWRGTERVAGLPLAERDSTALAQEVAVREVPGWREILERQRDRIANPDRRARFAFVMPALSADTSTRDAFFESLRDPGNREHEPWVLEALGYLHHPLRAERAVRYILPSLELLDEIQRTGDIFFPLGWLNATLDGHNTPGAARIVREFLETHPELPERLRGKVLQAADGLFRSAGIVYGEH
jgi:aminopeptidase N